MRYIDLDLLVGRPTAQLLIEATNATADIVFNEPDPAKRKALLQTHRDRWVAFRAEFEAVFGSKCWYTESRNPGTDDDIDHYRPKGRLAEAPTHGGYWWEAFSWRNFRLSSHRANRLRRSPDTGQSLGKGDHFPLVDESERWTGPDAPCRERPALLDPTDPGDPPLLTFDQDGRVALSPLYESDDVAKMRVAASRLYLHLDWPAFVEDRRDLYARVYTRVLDGDRAQRALDGGEMTAKDALKTAARDLIRCTSDHEPYSRAAQAYVMRFRDRSWVKRYVLPHIAGTVEK
jgi:hypothetical protein